MLCSHASPWRLLTSAHDGLARVWLWSPDTRVFQLYLTVNSALPLHTPTENTAAAVAYHFCHKHALLRPAPPPLLLEPHTRNGGAAEDARLGHAQTTEPELRTLLDQFDELVVSVQGGGAMCLWGISNLDRRLGETSASVVKIIPASLRDIPLDTFLHLQIVHHTHLRDADHVFWVGYSPSAGSITCFAAHIGALIYRPGASVQRVHTWGGHVTHAGHKAVRMLDGTSVLTQSGHECVRWRVADDGAALTFDSLMRTGGDGDPLVHMLFGPTDRTLLSSLSASDTVAGVRVLPDGTRVLSLATSTSLETYTLPDLVHPRTSHTFSRRLCATAFSTDADTVEAVALDETHTLHLLGDQGSTVLAQHAGFSTPSSLHPTAEKGNDVRELALAGTFLACRTATAVLVYALRALTHAPYRLETLDMHTTALALRSPAPGHAVLATTRGNTLEVRAISPEGTHLVAVLTHTFPAPVQCFQFTHTLTLIVFADDVVHLLAPYPPCAARAPAPRAMHHPETLRAWLVWHGARGVAHVEAVLNHVYYAMQAGLPQVPLVPPSVLFQAASTLDPGAAAADAGAELEALFAGAADPSALDSTVHGDVAMEVTPWSAAKAQTLKEMLMLAHESDPIRRAYVALLDLLPELQAVALDIHGQRYFTDLRLHAAAAASASLEAAPPTMLAPESFLFAYFSDSQASLADVLLQTPLTWSRAQSLGVGWWLRAGANLDAVLEGIARHQWRLASDPLDCFYFYLLLPGKRKLLLTLWKQAHGHPDQHVMATFLAQENTEKWRRTALKNAFVLLGKLRYELAACFFLLAEAYQDAVTVCLRNLRDVQRALVTCRQCQLPLTAVVQWLDDAATENVHPGLPWLCRWAAGETTFNVDRLLPAAPEMFLLYHSARREGATVVASGPPEVGGPRELERRALGYVLSHFRDRRWGAFCLAVLREYAGGTNNDDDNSNTGAGSQKVEDAFAALFGEADDSALRRAVPQAEDDDLFGPSPSHADPSPPTTLPVPAASTALLTAAERDAIERSVRAMLTQEALESLDLLAHHLDPAVHTPYFTDYPARLIDACWDPVVAARLCEVRLLPNHALLATRTLRPSLFRRLFAHLLETFDAEDTEASALERSRVAVSVVVHTLRTLARPELELDWTFPMSVPFQLLLLAVLVLVQALCVTADYDALATLLEHFHALLVPPLQPALQALCGALHPATLQPTDSSSWSSSRHPVLEYLATRMVLARLETLYAETLSDPSLRPLCTLLADTCFPALSRMLRRTRTHIVCTDTHVAPPTADWLSTAQQSLHAAVTYNPGWLDDLREEVARVPQSVARAFGSAGPAPVAAPVPALPAAPPAAYRVDTLFKNEYPILAMGLHASCRALALALHKHVIEINTDLAYRASHANASPDRSDPAPPPGGADAVRVSPNHTHPEGGRSSSSTALAGSGAVGAVAAAVPPVPAASTPPAMPSLRAPDFNLLKKVHLPRSNSEHLNLANISAEPGFVMERPVFPVSIASHPSLNLYALAQYVDNKSSLSLYAYHVKEDQMPISHYGSAKIVKLLFDSSGSRLGIADGNGELGLFDVESWRSFYNLPCHVRYTSDLVFYSKDSLVATAGSSPGHINNVALWDTLMPMNYAKVRGFNIHESGASALATDGGTYLVSGGKKGDLYVLDVRMTKPLFALHASHSCVSALAIEHTRVFAGTTDGTLRVYDLSASALTELVCLKHLHQSKKLIQTSLNQMPVSTLGITQIVTGESYVLTCGADGLVKWLH